MATTFEPGNETPGYSTREVDRWVDGQRIPDTDQVADEIPVALVYNGISHAVMMVTPKELDDFAMGFSLTEGILENPGDLYTIEVQPDEHGIRVEMRISARCFMHLKQRRRNLTGRTGCGICGVEMLEHAIRSPALLPDDLRVSREAIHHAFGQLHDRQPLQHMTGAVHAAGWAASDGQLHLVREDVGRHNALDKLIGALRRVPSRGRDGFIVITSRASYELVQKTAMAGIQLIAAISAPTRLAIGIAEKTRLTLMGFTRGDNHVLYTNPQRLTDTSRKAPE